MAEISKSLESRVSEFAARTGQEIKKVRGEIATSNTAAEALTQRVAANEGAITNLQSEVAKKVEIDDAQASATKTYSSQKVDSQITAAKQSVKNDLLGGAGEAYDTLKELADALVTNKDAITALQQIAQGHVQFDKAQALNDDQKKQARANIGALSAAVEKSGIALDTLTEEGSYVVTGATGLPADFTSDPVFVTVTKAGTATVQMVGGVQGAEYKLFARTAADGAYGEFAQIGAKTDLTDYAKKSEVATQISEAVNPVKATAEAAQAKANENAGKITALEATVGEHTTKLTSLESQVQTNTATIQKNAGDITTINANIGTKQDFVAAFEAALA
jgi:chromosome segregation ATPase